MATPKVNPPRGILNPKTGEKIFHLSRYEPAGDCAHFVEHYWIVRWDLRGQEPHRQENLPYPSVHLVFEKDNSHIFGVMTKKFTRRLENKGQVFGIKFRPGAFYPFVKTPVSRFADQILPVQRVFGADGVQLEQALLAVEDETGMVALADDFLRQRLPQPDPQIDFINQIIAKILAQPEIQRVEQVADRFHLSPRSLQRLFHRYVGISPKMVIQRYRLQEAADQVAADQDVDWPQLAQDLGYFDQAHFIKDFKQMVGKSPGEYTRGMKSIS